MNQIALVLPLLPRPSSPETPSTSHAFTFGDKFGTREFDIFIYWRILLVNEEETLYVVLRHHYKRKATKSALLSGVKSSTTVHSISSFDVF